jgi:hypothetical protein
VDSPVASAISLMLPASFSIDIGSSMSKHAHGYHRALHWRGTTFSKTCEKRTGGSIASVGRR